jgi:hypothetical protein
VTFDAHDPNFGESSTLLGNTFIAAGPFFGYTVSQVIALADLFIGGCATPGVSFTASQYNEVLSAINENFVDGKTDKGFLSCSPVGVAAKSLMMGNDAADVFEAFPNPVRDVLTIQLVHGTSGNVIVDVVDLSGRTIQQVATYGAEAGEERTHIVNMGALSPGIYLISVMKNDARSIKRIVVAH